MEDHGKPQQNFLINGIMSARFNAKHFPTPKHNRKNVASFSFPLKHEFIARERFYWKLFWKWLRNGSRKLPPNYCALSTMSEILGDIRIKYWKSCRSEKLINNDVAEMTAFSVTGFAFIFRLLCVIITSVMEFPSFSGNARKTQKKNLDEGTTIRRNIKPDLNVRWRQRPRYYVSGDYDTLNGNEVINTVVLPSKIP